MFISKKSILQEDLRKDVNARNFNVEKRNRANLKCTITVSACNLLSDLSC